MSVPWSITVVVFRLRLRVYVFLQNLLAELFLPAVFYLAVHAPLFGLFAGFRGLPFFALFFGVLDECGEPLQCLFFISLVGSMVLSFYDNYPLSAKAAVAQVEQPALDILGQAGVYHIKVQLDGGGDFIDILPTGALCSNLGYGYFPRRYGEGWMYCCHNRFLLGIKSFYWAMVYSVFAC